MATQLYLVRCNFLGTPEEEAAWNRWYSGPKLADMLAMPHFLAGRRYRSVALDQQVRYLAVWHVDGAQAFSTPRYLRRWGFADWSAHVGDWTRDLVSVEAGADEIADLLDGNRLTLTAFDRPLTRDDVAPALLASAAGLDRTWPAVAFEAGPEPAEPGPGPAERRCFRTHYELVIPDHDHRTAHA